MRGKKELTGREIVQLARHPKRPRLHDYLNPGFGMIGDFVELHGDRCSGDDGAIVGGFARFKGGGISEKVVVIGHEKGENYKDSFERHTGCAGPAGYRKALRLMRAAEKFKLPVLTFIDTAGAYPDDKSEEKGIAQAIARNLMEMSRLRTPIISTVIGEGGSGGALGIGVADRVLMMKNSYYSVITPEGCAAVLYANEYERGETEEAERAKRLKRIDECANSLKLRARDLLELKLIDEIIDEPEGGAQEDYELAVKYVGESVGKNLREIGRYRIDALIKRRYDRIRGMGNYFREAARREIERAEGARERLRKRRKI